MPEDSRNWGLQVGHALAVLIPALLSAAAGWFAGSSAGTAEVPTPASSNISERVDQGDDINDLKSNLDQANEKIAELTKKAIKPLDLNESTQLFVTPSEIDQDNCFQKIKDEIKNRGLNIYWEGGRNLQLKTQESALFLNCDQTGNVYYFVLDTRNTDADAALAKDIIVSAFGIG